MGKRKTTKSTKSKKKPSNEASPPPPMIFEGALAGLNTIAVLRVKRIVPLHSNAACIIN